VTGELDMKSIIEVWAITLLVFLRGRFGIRYLTWGMVWNGCLLLVVFPVGVALFCLFLALIVNGTLARLFVGESIFRLFVIVWGFVPYIAFFQWFVGLAIYRRLQTQARAENGDAEYTRSIAKPAEFWLRCRVGRMCRSATDVERILEPGAIIGIGAILILLCNWFGLYVLIGGICLRITAQRDFVDSGDTARDLRDGVIYAAHVAEEASLGEGDTADPVFTASLPPQESQSLPLPSVQEAFSALPGELREFVRPLRSHGSPDSGGMS